MVVGEPVRLYQPVVVVKVVCVPPEPPRRVVPVYVVPAINCELLLTRPVRLILPHCPAKVFQSASWSVPVELLPYFNLTMPPAFQKYLAASALAKVTVCVNVMVQAV